MDPMMDKLVICKPPDGLESRLDLDDVKKQLAATNAKIAGAFAGATPSLWLALALDIVQVSSQLDLICQELDAVGVHCVEVAWASRVGPQFETLEDLMDIINGEEPD
jgi:hypothetical protein